MWDFIIYSTSKVLTKPNKPAHYTKSLTLESWRWKMVLHFHLFVISRESNAMDIKSCILCKNACASKLCSTSEYEYLYFHSRHTSRVIRWRKLTNSLTTGCAATQQWIHCFAHFYLMRLIWEYSRIFLAARFSYWTCVSFTSCSVVGLKFAVCCDVPACAVRMSSQTSM